MKIKEKRHYGFGNRRPKIFKNHTERLAFNFSFLTKDSKHNLSGNSKYVTKDVKLKLLQKIEFLSKADITAVLNYSKKTGLEKLPENEVKISIHPEFGDRYQSCGSDYWVFRLGKLGRVIGKKNNNIFYVLSIDTLFKQYKHN